MLFRRLIAEDAVVAPLPGLLADGTTATLDLLPIPAALLSRQGDTLSVTRANRWFRAAGIGEQAITDELLPRLIRLTEGEAQHVFDWSFGDTIDRRDFRAHLSIAPIPSDGWLVTLIDRTSELRTEQHLRREMTIDSLTGLPNRAGFCDRLDSAMAGSGSRADLAVMIVDVDRFARFNACLGGLAGDELLITVARRLRGALRMGDVLARTGGDEFGILLSLEAGRDDAAQVARRIRDAFSGPIRLSDAEVQITVSVGVAFGEDVDADGENLIRQAQFAVKSSKKSGLLEIYQGQAFDRARTRFGLEAALRAALEAGELTLAFQPVCDLVTGRIHAFEALARWIDRDGVERLPSDFIPLAEEAGLIVPLGRWALAEAIGTLAHWDRRWGGSSGVAVAVNLSAVQLQRDGVAAVVQEQLDRHQMPADRLKLELTESALIVDPDRIARTLRSLKALGTVIAMDDFGTGYSNLGYLQQLPIDVLKIDQSFVTTMLQDENKIAIVRAILGLAQALGKKTVAEGIESAELGRTLAAMGCHMGQGYAYGRPLNADAAYELMVVRNS